MGFEDLFKLVIVTVLVTCFALVVLWMRHDQKQWEDEHGKGA